MQFASPLLGLGALVGGVSLVLLMYILKQQYKQKQIPSLLLWEKLIIPTKAQTPFQKLKKSMLLFLQLAAVTLIALALSRPFLSGGANTQQYILALDCSASMQATDIGESRFDTAKKDMQQLLEQSPPSALFSLVVLQDQPYIAASGGSASRILRILDTIEPTAGGVDWHSAKQLLTTEKTAIEGEVLLYTDTAGNLGDLEVNEQLYQTTAENTAITTLSHTMDSNGYYVLTTIHHYGNTPVEKTVTLYADGVAFDTKTISVAANAEQSITFSNVPADTQTLEAILTPTDVLPVDDARFEGLSSNSQQKICIVGDGNIFLEKALSVTGNHTVYTVKPSEASVLSGYGLYIFDGVTPETLPTDGHILYINPQTNNGLITVGEEQEFPTTVRGVSGTAFPNNETIAFELNKGTPLSANWGRAFLQSDGQTLGIYGETNGQKVAALGFALQQSDFPLQSSFPILLYHLTQWYFPENAAGLTQAISGESVTFSLQPATQQATVQTPNDTQVTIAPPYPAHALTDTAKTGIYTLSETDATGTVTKTPFGINAKIESESDLSQLTQTETQNNTTIIHAGRALTPLLLIVLLVILLIEWRVNCREH